MVQEGGAAKMLSPVELACFPRSTAKIPGKDCNSAKVQNQCTCRLLVDKQILFHLLVQYHVCTKTMSLKNKGCLLDGALGTFKISLNIDDATVYRLFNRKEA